MEHSQSAYRRGKCAVCTATVERQLTFTGDTPAAVQQAIANWHRAPLVHKRCEGQ